MAGSKFIGIGLFRGNKRVKRPGIQAKTKQSKNKGSKNYVKPYRGQGK
jgi:hypothetical protein